MARKKQETAESQAISPVLETEIGQAENVVKAKRTARAKTAKTTEKVEKAEKAEQTEKTERKPVRRKTTATKTAEVKMPELPEEAQKAEKTEKPKRERKAKKTAQSQGTPLQSQGTPLQAEEKLEEKAEEPKSVEEKPQEKKTATRAEKNATLRSLIKELLTARPYKWSELLETGTKLYAERVESVEGQNANDVRGRIGSVCDAMKKDGEVAFDGGMYALNTEKKVSEAEKAEPTVPQKGEEKPQEKQVEKAEVKTEEAKTEKVVPQEKQLPAIKPEAKVAPVFDMSLLLGKKEEKQGGRVEKNQALPKKEELQQEVKGDEAKKEEKPIADEKTGERILKKVTKKSEEPKKEEKAVRKTDRKPTKTADEKLKEEFLKRIRTLSGKYFEYYSIYLLERYSLANGRRVDGFRVTGGDNDGGIDGEIELTDAIGFRETIYIQAKNWKPIYGREASWVIGEKELREFIGAIAYRQALEGKQNCRGIFITTSFFTAGAKEILYKMSDKLVGYDGDDLFEAAKECSFGLVQKDGQWKLDEKILSGEKVFFNLY